MHVDQIRKVTPSLTRVNHKPSSAPYPVGRTPEEFHSLRRWLVYQHRLLQSRGNCRDERRLSVRSLISWNLVCPMVVNRRVSQDIPTRESMHGQETRCSPTQSRSSPSNLCFCKKVIVVVTNVARFVASWTRSENFPLPWFQPPTASNTFGRPALRIFIIRSNMPTDHGVLSSFHS